MMSIDVDGRDRFQANWPTARDERVNDEASAMFYFSFFFTGGLAFLCLTGEVELGAGGPLGKVTFYANKISPLFCD